MDQILHVYIACSVILALIIVTSLIGNSLIIAYFGWKETKKKTSYQLFILALSISDLSGTISGLLVFIQFNIGYANNVEGSLVLCMVTRPLYELFLGISSFLIVGMSYERYRGITKAMECRQPKKRFVAVYIVAVCVGWTLYSIPLYLSSDNYDWPCNIKVTDILFNYTVTVFVVKSIVPSILMWFFYVKIKQTLKQQEDLGNSIIMKRNKAALRTLRLLIIFFEIFVVIPSVFPIIKYKIRLAAAEDLKWWNELLYAAGYAPAINNAANCFVYAGYVKEFRTFLRDLCYRFKVIRRLPPQSTEHELQNI